MQKKALKKGHIRRQGIRETGIQGQRQYDIDKLFHRAGKDTIKRQKEGVSN